MFSRSIFEKGITKKIPIDYEISIMDVEIDNPGGGDCAFYALAIGLIYLIQQEAIYKCHDVFDRWVAANPSIKQFYQQMLQVDLQQETYLKKSNMLYQLQKSLREISFKVQLQELQEACANTRGCNIRLVAYRKKKFIDKRNVINGEEILVIKRGENYFLGFKNVNDQYQQVRIVDESIKHQIKSYQVLQIIDDGDLQNKLDKILKTAGSKLFFKQEFKSLQSHSLVDQFFGLYSGIYTDEDEISLSEFREIKSLLRDLRNRMPSLTKGLSFKEQQAKERKELYRAFIKLIYGEDTHLETITSQTEPKQNSPIIKALALVKKDRYWGSDTDLNALCEIFKININKNVNGVCRYVSKNTDEYKDYDLRHSITLNNRRNVHWTTLITLAKVEAKTIEEKSSILQRRADVDIPADSNQSVTSQCLLIGRDMFDDVTSVSSDLIESELSSDSSKDSIALSDSFDSDILDEENKQESLVVAIIDESLTSSKKQITETVTNLINRLRVEYLRELKSRLADSKDKEIYCKLTINSLETHLFITHSKKLKCKDDLLNSIMLNIEKLSKIESEIDLEVENLSINHQLPEVEKVIQVMQNKLNNLSKALANIENAKPIYKQWHQLTQLIKNLIEFIGKLVSKEWKFETLYSGPIKSGFWKDSNEIKLIIQEKAPQLLEDKASITEPKNLVASPPVMAR